MGINIKKINIELIFVCISIALAMYVWSAEPAAAIGEPCAPATVESDCYVGQTCASGQCKWMEGYSCRNAAECASVICQSIGGEMRCGCTGDDQCLYEDQRCETATHRCVTATARWGGEPCSSNTDCSSGECRSGTCTCRANSDCPGARAGTQICMEGSCVGTSSRRCTTTADCASGVCLPRGTCGCNNDSDCTGGGQCQEGECITATTTFGTTGPVEFTSPLGPVSPTQILGRVIKAVLGILGAIALSIFVYGGFVWMTSGGSPEKIKTAQATLIWAVIGMLVIFASYAAVDLVLKAFGV